VTLEGGAQILSTDEASGEVAVSIQPWEVTLRPPGAGGDSARNALRGSIASVAPAGNRLRVSLALPEPLVAEVTAAALDELRLGAGDDAVASFKASATRVFAR
jgi:molybdopterin-binding protein